ncbi:peptidylprolyl isomerase [Reinekea sp.]|jgi:FKBP-type peptidyl-prolyl cis-trans isomerase SlyD|uniref:FKBP-type peptidyl-prolyl cis-trans isomerase n=1 Tax=Reinekea sp. TaxID=1970455 RepID=UPI002A818A76|nr:peptidylprolyl isomerase [Reinekea sp.]
MIAENKIVTLQYSVQDSDGTLIDSSEANDPLVYMHGAHNIITGLESALLGKANGESFDVVIEPVDAYGEHNAELVQVVPKSAFEGVEQIEAGMVFTADTPNGPMQLTVTAMEGDDVTIDPNHPLAGKTLHFTGSISDIRDATEEELEHGHVHGAGGAHD